jgi:hypothetical protein
MLQVMACADLRRASSGNVSRLYSNKKTVRYCSRRASRIYRVAAASRPFGESKGMRPIVMAARKGARH